MESIYLSESDIKSIDYWLSKRKRPKDFQRGKRRKARRAYSILQLKYKMIANGSHRIVYDLGNNNVLKIVISNKGYKNNKIEDSLYRNCPPELQKHLCPVKDFGQGWIIMEKMTPGIPSNEEYAKKLIQLKNKFLKYGIIAADIAKTTNLSLSNDKEIVVIDYGNFKTKSLPS